MIEISDFISHLSTLCPDFRNKKYLLAISGGIDSVVMLNLFYKANLSFSIAHCNFQLRNNESERDMNFVYELSQTTSCRLFERCFDTKKFAKEGRLNTQDAARRLRYSFFKEIADTNGFDFICTAHNQDDVIETLIMGLNRRGGLATLAGIREIEDKILRPILCYSRLDIENFAAKEMISYVEDSSNKENKYLRNKIRHKLLPILEDLMPGFCNRASSSVAYLREHQKYFDEISKSDMEKLGNPYNEGLDLIKLQNHNAAKLILMQFLLSNGFTPSDADNILDIKKHSEPAEFIAANKRLLAHRGRLFLIEINEDNPANAWYIDEDLETDSLPLKINISIVHLNSKNDICADNKVAYLDANEITFPLLVRKWQPGERFIPLGMDNFKKIGDFFTNLKTNIVEREKAKVIVVAGKVAWLVGYRIDSRFKIKQFPCTALKIELF